MSSSNIPKNFIVTIYTYLVSAFLGWQIFSFINIYFQLNQNRIELSFQKWMAIQTNYFPIVALILILLLGLLFKYSKNYHFNYIIFRRHILYLIGVLVFSFLNYILYIFNLHQNIFELINFIFVVLCLQQLSKLFYIKEKATWFHQTTIGAFYISAILLGISQLILFELITYPFTGYAYSLLVVLTIEILRIFMRFKYLTKFNYETNQIARLLLGKYGIYFGVRVIVGIFMPVVYTFYALYTNDKLIMGVGVLLVIGELLERILFIYLSGSIKQN